MDQVSREDFPAGFRFGVASSSLQIEGTARGGCGPSQWDRFLLDKGPAQRDWIAHAIGHYDRWQGDLDLIRDGGFRDYRFSVNWSRLFPDAEGVPNRDGFDFYDRLIDGMAERGIAPHMTLFHWEMPDRLALIGGWAHPDTAPKFADFAEAVIGRFGDRLASVATFNEPWNVCWHGYFTGLHAPGLRDLPMAAKAMHGILLGHGRAVEAIRGVTRAVPAGCVVNLEHMLPLQSEQDVHAQALYDALHNRWFLEAVLTGHYPPAALSLLERNLPDGWTRDLRVISTPVDWIGLNYYTAKRVGLAPGGAAPLFTERENDLPKTSSGWTVCPEGLNRCLARISGLAPDLPIIVTENGINTVEGHDDAERWRFIQAHLRAIKTALDDGVKVGGYFYWSMFDNMEWTEGFQPRFGIVEITQPDLERRPRRSWERFRAFLHGQPTGQAQA